MTTPHEALRAWRGERTVVSCAALVGVKHPTWLDWEAGKKRPRIEHAIEIEKLTEGAVPVIGWTDNASPRLAADDADIPPVVPADAEGAS